MQKLITTAAVTTLSTLIIGLSANALTLNIPIDQHMKLIEEFELANASSSADKTPIFNIDAKIGIARLDKGRLIPAPIGEMRDWSFLDKRSDANFELISPAAVIKNIPDVPMNGKDSYNKIDEIRMTAADLKMEYVLIYGMGKDAAWGSFGGKALMETGLLVDEDQISPRAGAKALLVNTYSGKIYGTVTSEQIEFGVGELTDKVDALIDDLISNEEKAKA
jgi:hypothetical protein